MVTELVQASGCVCVPPAGGEEIRIFDEEIVVKVSGTEGDGAYAVLVGSVAPGGGPPLHAHPSSETFYVLSGEFDFTERGADGVSTYRGGPGTTFHAPAGVPHRFENVSPTRSSMLFVVPVESVNYLRELAAAFPPGAQPDMEKMLALHAKHQVETFYGESGSRPEPATGEAPSARAHALAWRLQAASDSLAATLAVCTAKQWRTVCADTGWTVGVQAHHVAVNEAAILAVAQGVVAGHPHPPLPPGKLDEINARHAADFADVTPAETIPLLRDQIARATAAYRTLSDEQLALPVTLAADYTVTIAELIERLAIGEVERHGAFIRAAIRA
jgi:quercetin dioxygenase-like cupin family protein